MQTALLCELTTTLSASKSLDDVYEHTVTTLGHHADLLEFSAIYGLSLTSRRVEQLTAQGVDIGAKSPPEALAESITLAITEQRPVLVNGIGESPLGNECCPDKAGPAQAVMLPLSADSYSTFNEAIVFGIPPFQSIDHDVLRFFQTVAQIVRTNLDLIRARDAQRWQDLALQAAPLLSFTQDRELRYTHIQELAGGLSPSEALARTDAEIYPIAFAAPLEAVKRRALAMEERCQARVQLPFSVVNLALGTTTYDLWVEPLMDATGQVCGLIGCALDVSNEVQTTSFLVGERELMQALSEGLSVRATLERLTQLVEQLAGHGVIASILLLDEDGQHLRHGAAPGLPPQYNQAIDGIQIGPSVGSCGTAAFTGERVIVEDILTDPRWIDFKGLATDHGLRSCWSTPIRASDRQVVGTFAMYYREPRSPSPEDLRIIDLATRTAAIVIERNRTEQALQTTRDEITDFVENATVGLHWMGPDGRIMWANKAELEMLGYERDEYVGHHISEFHVDADAARSFIKRVTTEDAVANAQVRLRTKSGEIRYVSVSSNTLRRDGQLVHVRSFSRDITERRLAMEARSQLATIVESTHDAVIGKTIDGIITSWNRGAEEMYGHTASEVIGKPVSIIVPPEHPDELPRIMEQLRQGQRIDNYETVRMRKDGSRIDVSVSISPLRDAGGELSGAASIGRDISQRRGLERMQQDFIANVSHELRNPLGSIRGYAQLAQRRGRYDAHAMETIVGQTRHLERLVQDLLEASRIESGHLQLRREPTDLLPLVQLCVEQANAESAHHRIRIDAAASAIRGIWDPVRIEQILQNLLSNAIKYAPDGGDITVSLRKDGRYVRVSVADSGLGIDAAAIPHLFERFYRAGAPARGVRGVGLGLYIARELVEAHEGTIWVESAGLHRGSTFTFTLPLSQTHARREGDGPSVLVVDDDDALRELITDILEDEGYHVNAARNGIDALNCLESIQPAVILLDWMMPMMDGPGFASELKKRGLCPDTPIVVMTAAGEARQRAATIGANAYLPKPFDVSLLIEEVAQLAGGTSESES